MKIPLLDLAAQDAKIGGATREAVMRVLNSQRFILADEVRALERSVADYSQCAHGIGVSSGSDALLVALMALDVHPGDEIITTPYTFFATAGCITRLGAKPVFVDIDPESYNLDAGKIEAQITTRTKGIIVVHLFGQIAAMDRIMEIATHNDLFVVEDAAQAIGSLYRERRAGSLGHIGCFSFFPSKNLGGIGDGGMVVTNDSTIAEKIRILRSHGSQPKYFHKVVGGNFRLDEIQAAVLSEKLKHLEKWTAARRRNADRYRRLFTEAKLCGPSGPVQLPVEKPQRKMIYNQYVIRVLNRNGLMSYLRRHEIGCGIYYPQPMHLQECFSHLGYATGALPLSEQASQQTLAIPIYPELTEEMQRRIIDVISKFYTKVELAKSSQ